MTQNTKRIASLCFAVALAAVILLASSLSNLQLQAGMPFPGGGNAIGVSQALPDGAPEQDSSSTILKGIFDLLILILILSVPVRIIPLVNMKKLFQALLVLAALLLLASLVARLPGVQPAHVSDEPSHISTPASFDYPVSSLGQPPQGIIWMVLTGVVLGAGILVLRLVRQWQDSTRVEDRLSQEAESAIHAIKTGESLRSVIVRCYVQMSQVLQQEQKIERSADMTVHEFESLLASKGYPGAAVHQLSELFEKARYGGQETVREDETAAVNSLNEIIQFCRVQQDGV